MRFTVEQRRSIYNRTTGKCHLCHKKLAFKNYGRHGGRGAWEVEHSIPQANGGTHHLNNLYTADICCNRSKGTSSTKAARRSYGKSRAPLSREKRKTAKVKNAIFSALVAGSLGALVNPVACIVGAIIGGQMAYRKNPDK